MGQKISLGKFRLMQIVRVPGHFVFATVKAFHGPIEIVSTVCLEFNERSRLLHRIKPTQKIILNHAMLMISELFPRIREMNKNVVDLVLLKDVIDQVSIV